MVTLFPLQKAGAPEDATYCGSLLPALSRIGAPRDADKESTLKHLVDMLETPSNMRDLLAFSVTVDLKSMTGAAKNLLESKGSISRRLTRLEKQLGVNL